MPEQPLIRLEPNGKAPVLRYDVPEPTSYSGTNLVELDLPAGAFKEDVQRQPPEGRTPIHELDTASLRTAVAEGMRTGFANARLFPNIRTSRGELRFVESPTPEAPRVACAATTERLAALDANEVTAMMENGMRLNVYRSMFGTLTYNYIPEPTTPRARLYLVEEYRLSSFLGDYGAGKVLKTFTLLPGEKTRISVKSFRKTEEERKSSSSILDSFTQESADDFENSVQREQTDKRGSASAFEYYADAEANASWGFGSASAKAGVKGSTNASREQFAKKATAALQKHASRASAKREVEINTSYEVSSTEQEETSIERELENVNLSRTLNFVFRQMNQEFVSLLHLVDMRVGFFNGFAESRIEVSIDHLDDLLEEVIVEDQHDTVRQAVLEAFGHVADCKDDVHSLIEEREVAGDRYVRVRRELSSTYVSPGTSDEITVPGIVMAVQHNVMRTDGVIVEALLGEGRALDAYAEALQEDEVRARRAETDASVARAERESLINRLADAGELEKARGLALMTCPCGPCDCGHRARSRDGFAHADPVGEGDG